MNHLLRAAFARLLMLRCQPPSPWIIVLSTLIWALAMHCASALARTPQPSTTRYEYDVNGNITRIVDPLGRATVRRYDSLNRLIEQQQPAPASGAPQPTIVYSYDARSQLTAVKDPRGLSTHYAIDGLGQETALASPDTGLATRTFDAAGHHTSTSDARGQSTTFERDALGRVTRIVYASGVPSSFEYDTGSTGAVGQLGKMTDESGQTVYLYDDAGRLISKTVSISGGAGDAKSFTVGYAYGMSGASNGKLIDLAYPSGNHVLLKYGQDGQVSDMSVLKSGTSTPVVLLSDIRYHPSGAVQSWTWGNDTAAVPNRYFREFDSKGRIIRLPFGNILKGGAVRTITYDNAGRITKTDHVGTGQPGDLAPNLNQRYAYDDLDRIINSTGHGTAARYQYDGSGNRTQVTYGGQTFVSSINPANNQLQATTGPQTVRRHAYDKAGNLINDGMSTYIYNARGRLRSAQAGSSIASYSHNGLDQRTMKIVGAGAADSSHHERTYFVYDEFAQLIAEYDTQGSMIQETIYLGNLPVAVLKGRNGNATLASGLYHVYSDHVNTPRVITESIDNQIVWRWDLADPFGASQPVETLEGKSRFSYNLRFPGQYYDRETNLHYNYHRNYDPQTGRYVQSDPIGLRGGINTYMYAGANPLSHVDPLGLRPFPDDLSPPGARPLPMPGDVFQPGTAANNAFVASVHRLMKALQSSKSSLEACEADCDAEFDIEQRNCEWQWKCEAGMQLTIALALLGQPPNR